MHLELYISWDNKQMQYIRQMEQYKAIYRSSMFLRRLETI